MRKNYGLKFKLPKDPRTTYTSDYIEFGSSLNGDYYGASMNTIRSMQVEDQGKHGSCVGQTVSKIKEYSLKKELSARYVYVLTDKFYENGNGGGLQPSNACKMLSDIGVVEDKYCEDKNRLSSEKYYDVSRLDDVSHYKSYGYSYVPRNLEDIKKAFNKHEVLVLAVTKGRFNRTGELTSGGFSNHAVMAFAIQKEGNKHKIFFLNSWGKRWGDDGIGYFYYEDILDGKTNFYLMAISNVPKEVIEVNKNKYPILRKGKVNEAVRRLQTILGITSDGIFGPQTKRTVIKFQIKNMLYPDGIVGPKTWNKLLNNN